MLIIGRGAFPIQPVEDKGMVNSPHTLHKFCSLLTNGKGVQDNKIWIFHRCTQRYHWATNEKVECTLWGNGRITKFHLILKVRFFNLAFFKLEVFVLRNLLKFLDNPPLRPTWPCLYGNGLSSSWSLIFSLLSKSRLMPSQCCQCVCEATLLTFECLNQSLWNLVCISWHMSPPQWHTS
jgi:hypothetical protein